jgi:hypothetical protein
MVERKVESQSVNLTFDHEKSRITLSYMLVGGVLHIVRKLSTRDTILIQTSSQSKVYTRSYGCPKWWQKSQFRGLQDSQLGSPKKNVIWEQPPWRATKNIIRGKVVVSPKSGPW